MRKSRRKRLAKERRRQRETEHLRVAAERRRVLEAKRLPERLRNAEECLAPWLHATTPTGRTCPACGKKIA